MINGYLKKIGLVLVFLSSYFAIYAKQFLLINNSSMTVFVSLFSDDRYGVLVGGQTVEGNKTVTITNPTSQILSLKFYTSGKSRLTAFARPSNCENQTFEIKDDVNKLTVSNYCN